jgi:hypothetical protein
MSPRVAWEITCKSWVGVEATGASDGLESLFGKLPDARSQHQSYGRNGANCRSAVQRLLVLLKGSYMTVPCNCRLGCRSIDLAKCSLVPDVVSVGATGVEPFRFSEGANAQNRATLTICLRRRRPWRKTSAFCSPTDHVSGLPKRETSPSVKDGISGNIRNTTQIEKDAWHS